MLDTPHGEPATTAKPTPALYDHAPIFLAITAYTIPVLEQHIEQLEQRIRLGFSQLGWVRVLKSLPGVGNILSATIFLEIGALKRFAAGSSDSAARRDVD